MSDNLIEMLDVFIGTTVIVLIAWGLVRLIVWAVR